ncbi:MAG: hypothetical protein K2W80_03425, partial [Burkholderiales bacterium]|nr:hypothetical protein [Burkholderiales bacterium]
MLLLFFLMVALGMLSLLWLYFPVEGVQPADPLPPRPQVSTPAPPAEAPAVPTAAAAAGAPATVTDATGGIDP